ncbi:MAG: efflux RND transporter permease subunit, partial [Planctomycetota bacterium]
MNVIQQVIRQPVTVAVGVLLTLLAGLIALQRIPIQLTPNVEDTIIAVTTRWEGASPEEVEREIIEEQEERLQGLANLRAMTSVSQQGWGTLRLEFTIGTEKEAALREVSDKLREVPDYPENADEPVIEASDPENRDFIAWIILESTDPDLEIRTMQDFADDRIKPVLERVPGMSEINVLGGREREAQIRFDPVRLAQLGITPASLVSAIDRTNRNVSGGQLPDAKFNVRLRTVSQYASIQDVEETVIADTAGGPIFIRDVAEVVETYKEPFTFVRSRGRPVIAINAQKEVGSNVMEVMAGLKTAIERLNRPGNVLDTAAQRMRLDGKLQLRQVYDQTVYIDDALALVRNNIWLGGSLAVLVLLLFLRSLRSVAIIALAIPISIIGAVVVMVVMGRTVNVISLAGMAFATGLVVDNAIVVLENIFRHLEMGKAPLRAAYDGTREVWGAILGSTLTTIFVFVPILLVQDEAGQLFRDIALAICAAVGLSLLVSVTVIPASAARLLRSNGNGAGGPGRRPRTGRLGSFLHTVPELIGRLIYRICGSTVARLGIVVGLTVLSIVGSYALMPPLDYLPQGNRNLVFGLMLPPPGYNLDQQVSLARRVEKTVRPYWEAGRHEPGSPEYREAWAALPSVPTGWMTGQPGATVVPPPIKNYFLVSFDGILFHGAISHEPKRVVDLLPLFQHATRAEVAPGVLAFAFQVPLFQLGGSSGSAIKIDFAGDDLSKVSAAAAAAFQSLGRDYGYHTIQPSPSNFNIHGPELRLVPDKRRLADIGLTPADLALAAQACGDGAIIGEYRLGSDTIDLKLIDRAAVGRQFLGELEDIPLASADGQVVSLGSVASFQRVTSPPEINHVGRQRSVTLNFTPPQGTPLEQAIAGIRMTLDELRDSGQIAPDVAVGFAGSASKLASVQRALLGDGTLLGTINSSMVMALIVVYLLMCVLFQSFARPMVIMFSVPLATLGGFAALYIVFKWTDMDRYLPIQTLDVLTMLGFVILIGVVVNNA